MVGIGALKRIEVILTRLGIDKLGLHGIAVEALWDTPNPLLGSIVLG